MSITALYPEAVTVADLADVPIWRHDPEPECEHGATTVTGHAALWSHDGHGDVDIVATTAAPITLCLVCHRLAPTPQEDPQP